MGTSTMPRLNGVSFVCWVADMKPFLPSASSFLTSSLSASPPARSPIGKRVKLFESFLSLLIATPSGQPTFARCR